MQFVFVQIRICCFCKVICCKENRQDLENDPDLFFRNFDSILKEGTNKYRKYGACRI